MATRGKLGILTIHHHENDGSVMQAYCLQQLLTETLPDWDVGILNVYPIGHAVDAKQILKPLLRGEIGPREFWARLRKLRTYERFYRSRYRHQGPSLATNDMAALSAYVQRHGFEAIVAGSDTLWEIANRWCGLPAPPNYFFLLGLPSQIKKIAYAISADPLPQQIPGDVDIQAVKRSVEDFDFISVRDGTTKSFLEGIGVDPRRLEFMPDPTLAFDFSAIVPTTAVGMPKHNALCLAVTDPVRRAAIACEARLAGYSIVNMVGDLPEAEWDRGSRLSVEARLGVYKSIGLLVTDRFHSSIFTLKLNDCRTPVIVIEDEAKWPLPNSKCRDLFGRLGLDQFVVRTDEQPLTGQRIRALSAEWSDNVSRRASDKLRGLGDFERKQLARIKELLGH